MVLWLPIRYIKIKFTYVYVPAEGTLSLKIPEVKSVIYCEIKCIILINWKLKKDCLPLISGSQNDV